jgi:nephrocystin-3
MSTPSRLVRVFISSTFRDFMGERDELVKSVFPELRRRCRARFVELLEVDLRWGITEEQSNSGATLKICLQEIDRCRPSEPVFFIGLLGERYGWVPERNFYPADVLDDPEFSWVREHVEGRSVTELEILHGVLNNPKMHDRAFFFFRNDGYAQRHWPSIQVAYPDLKPEDFTNDAEKDQSLAIARQESLKLRVIDASLKHSPRSYETPEELAALVREALWAQIDATFPASEVPDALEHETIDHRVFCDSRTRAYVEREGMYDALDQHVEGEGPIGRVVLGESGSGKSALLASWLHQHQDKVVLYHFVGSTPQSASAESILTRLAGELRQKGVLPRTMEIPRDRSILINSVPSWLERLSQQGGGIILLDALNQLTSPLDRQLDWWPQEWPENIRVVFSTLPGDAWRAMQGRGWAADGWCITVQPLQSDEKREVMKLYLQRFSRALEPALQERILAAPQTANPLFLRTVLDELRLRARHEDLGHHLDAMLAFENPEKLFVHMLKNLERDFTPVEHPGMVHDAMGLMGLACRGLTESEILELLSTAEHPAREPLPRHYWAPVFLALEDSLVSREGQLSFFHDYLRKAGWLEYLDEDREQEKAHGRLAETVTLWQDEQAVGASLRSYGFEHGISHLLARARVREALDLLLADHYRHAAALTLRRSAPVLRNVQDVRRAAALEDLCQPEEAATLTQLALTGRSMLETDLRQALDQSAQKEDWETVMGLAAAGENESMSMLLACRALLQGGMPKNDSDAVQLRALMKRWSAGKDEWEELSSLLMPGTAIPHT